MLSRQFLLSMDRREPPIGWRERRLGTNFVYHSPDLPWIDLHLPSGRGAILGWPIFEGRLWKDGESIEYGSNGADAGFPLLSGRFLALVEEAGSWFAYPDPCGQLPLVYCSEFRVAAATPGLICDPHRIVPPDPAVNGGEYWFPFGLTSRDEVERLLPNHRLDLGSWQSRRFWPRAYVPEQSEASDAALDAIAHILRENVGAIVANARVIANLTAGRDTRMVLAALRSHCSDIIFSTFRFPGKGGVRDCDVAERIAATFSLDHREIVPLPAEAADVAQWLDDTGHCVAGQAMTLATTVKAISHTADFNLTGLAGEVGRAGYWTADHLSRKSVGPAELLSLTRAGDSDRLLEAARRWLAELPAGPVHWILDMLAMEIRIGTFSAPAFYGNCGGAISLTPFNDRRLIELALSLPAHYRFEQRLTHDLLDRMWPELNDFPFNPPSEPAPRHP